MTTPRATACIHDPTLDTSADDHSKANVAGPKRTKREREAHESRLRDTLGVPDREAQGSRAHDPEVRVAQAIVAECTTASWSSPGPASPPTRESRTSEDPRACGPRTPKPRSSATLQNYMSDPEVRRRAWQSRLTSPTWQAAPNAGHLALVALERAGRARHLGDPERRRAAPGGRPRPGPGHRDPRHHAGGDVHVLRGPHGDGGGRSSGCAPAKTTLTAPALRRDEQGHAAGS